MNFGSFHNLLFSFCEVDEVVGIVIILFRSAKPLLSATETVQKCQVMHRVSLGMSDMTKGTRFCSANIYKSVQKIPNFQSLGDRQTNS